ncbi:SDR family NAD(P)-dependent oxidoreductase [Kineosporia babensis]|uniref:SDR family NAD(P)-dependent oxidoreductase n=1 Tax=Kineosporia babensis TaxID=499548 RepID=A0A9X1SVU9_9ACTN|nr:SDR family NAD(P)-dependent oxidoreductase [Kineosporia babensis]MCD5314081.1 SDR family NAD(P)-dependent oxidoreductase [Kineosporia babensis]
MARVLITGASAGLGLNTARALTDAGHDVVVHARGSGRMPDWPKVVLGDLSDLQETRGVAEQAQEHGPFTAVIHNAGTMDPAHAFAVNVIAPYVLTALLERPERLIYLTSSMHRGGSDDLGRIGKRRVTYSDSKLYVTALSAAWATRWPGTVTHAVDPGWVPTRMGGSGAPDDLVAGHETQTWLATADRIDPSTGGYWHHRRTQDPHPAVTNGRFQQQLLDLLGPHTGVKPD